MYKILVADDEAGIRSFVRKYAEFDGHEVIEASDGMEAVSVFKSQKIDIIIMDRSPSQWTGWISLQSKGLSRVFSNTTVQKHQFLSAQLYLWSNPHIQT